MISNIYLISGAMLKTENTNPLQTQISRNYKNIAEQIITNKPINT